VEPGKVAAVAGTVRDGREGLVPRQVLLCKFRNASKSLIDLLKYNFETR
jgi:hypothetical protein